MAGIYRCILLLIVGLFFSSLSYAKNTEIPSYEEGISLFDVEATLQPDGVLDIKENIHFSSYYFCCTFFINATLLFL